MKTILAAVLVAGTLAAVPMVTHAVDDPERVLIVGDSVTQGWRGDHTWRYFAWKDLEQTGASVDFVGSASGTYSNGDWNYTGDDAYADPDFDQQHAAVAGGALQVEGHSLLSWPVADEIADHDPQTVVSMWGVNDLSDLNHSVDDVLGYYEGWFARARAAKPSVDFVVAELPQTWLYDGRVVEFNAGLRALAGELSTSDSRIVVATPGPMSAESDFIDGVHPTPAGERKIAAMMVQAIEPLLG